MLISVVIPVYNSAATLERTLLSISKQNRLPDEVVIVDDGSTDNFQKVLEGARGSLPITLITNAKNQGIGFSLRTGVEQSIGDLIFRIDADDYWEPQHIQLSEQIFLSNPKVVLCNTGTRLIDLSGKELGLRVAVDDYWARKALISDNPFVHSAVSFRKHSYYQVGGYPQGVRWEDYSLWIDMASLGSIGAVPEVTLNYLVTANSLSRVAKGLALKDRWLCQKKAISIFGKKYPIAVLQAAFAFYVKTAIGRLN